VGDVLEADIEQQPNVRVVERVVDVSPLLSVANETLRAEEAHVVADRGPGEVADRGQVADAELTGLEECRDQAQPARVGQDAKRLGEVLENVLVGQSFEHRGYAVGVDALDLAAVERRHRCVRYLHSHEDIIARVQSDSNDVPTSLNACHTATGNMLAELLSFEGCPNVEPACELVEVVLACRLYRTPAGVRSELAEEWVRDALLPGA
jgi:hypothetical protein